MKIVMEEVPPEFLKWLGELYDRLSVISVQVDKAKRLVLELNQRLTPKEEEEYGEQGTEKGS